MASLAEYPFKNYASKALKKYFLTVKIDYQKSSKNVYVAVITNLIGHKLGDVAHFKIGKKSKSGSKKVMLKPIHCSDRILVTSSNYISIFI